MADVTPPPTPPGPATSAPDPAPSHPDPAGPAATPPGAPTLDPALAALLKRDPNGLLAAVVQDDRSGEVLMVGWMDDEALRRTLTSGRVTFWSRSRSEYWRKGDTSGHVQYVQSVALDCDGDALLVRVDQVGAACHTGRRSCFFRDLGAVVADPGVGADVRDAAEEGAR